MNHETLTTSNQMHAIRTILAARQLLTPAGLLVAGYGHDITMPANLNQYTDVVDDAFRRVSSSDAGRWIAAHSR